MKLRYASVLALSAAVSAQADTYQLELNAGWMEGNIEDNSEFGSVDVNYDGYLLSGAIYFEEVDARDGPLREAAFLDRKGSISVVRTDLSESVGTTTTDIGSRFLSDDYILELGFNRISYVGEDEDADETSFSVGFGAYLNDHSDIVATVSRSDEIELDSYAVNYHSVIQTGGSAWGIDVLGSYMKVPYESGYRVNVGATYYPNTKFGIGANIDLLSIGDYEKQTISALAEYFFFTNLAGTLSYSYTTVDDGLEVDSNLITASLTARF